MTLIENERLFLNFVKSVKSHFHVALTYQKWKISYGPPPLALTVKYKEYIKVMHVCLSTQKVLYLVEAYVMSHYVHKWAWSVGVSVLSWHICPASVSAISTSAFSSSGILNTNFNGLLEHNTLFRFAILYEIEKGNVQTRYFFSMQWRQLFYFFKSYLAKFS